MVADAGYRLVDDPTAPEYLVSGITEEELRCAQVDLVFSHLIASDEHFRNFAKIGKILLAQKSPVPSAVPVQKGVRLRVARAIDAAFTAPHSTPTSAAFYWIMQMRRFHRS